MHGESKVISYERLIVETKNKHFVNSTKKLKLKLTETGTKELTLSEILDRNKDLQSII